MQRQPRRVARSAIEAVTYDAMDNLGRAGCACSVRRLRGARGAVSLTCAGATRGISLSDGFCSRAARPDLESGGGRPRARLLGRIRQVDILQYRESYGGEIRSPSWLAQFAGKTNASPLQVGNDIRNISGATLSSHHVTEGVKRIMAIANRLK
ncbi:MAG: FMN-binding protein [Alphaproteobacteria bacterium]|nr:MAG: FMN-binding protein [Alphaproteobacteria bacterium]